MQSEFYGRHGTSGVAKSHGVAGGVPSRNLPRRRRQLSAGQQDNVIAFLSRNLKHDIHVDDLARQVGLSCAHFAELFVATTGCSPFRYIKTLRLRTAHELLTLRGLSVAEAAEAVGYLDVDHFAEVFRKFWGCSAREVAARARSSAPGAAKEMKALPDIVLYENTLCL